MWGVCNIKCDIIVFSNIILLFFVSAQGKVGDMVSEIFNINHDYVGSLVSNIAKVSLCMNTATYKQVD